MGSDALQLEPVSAAGGESARHYGSTVAAQGVALCLGVLTGVLTARMLGPEGRGEYAAIFVWTTGIAALIGFGINQAVAFYLGKRAFTLSEISTAATAIWMGQSVLSISACILILHYALAAYSPQVRHAAVIFSLATPAFIGGGYPPALFQGAQNPVKFNVLRSLTPAVYCVILALLYLMHRWSIGVIIGSQAFSYVLVAAIGIVMVRVAFRPTWNWNKAVIKSLIHFGARAQTTSLTSYFNQRIDQVMLSLFVPPQQLGYYAVAVSLAAAVIVFPQAAGIVTFSKGSSQQHGDAIATMGVALRASFIWLLVTCGVLYLLADFLIRHVFGNAFEGSILACRILIPGALMMGMNQVLYNGASALGRPGLPALAEGASMLVTAVGLFLLVPHYGYIGAAIVSSIAYTISFFVMLFLANRFLAIDLRTLLLPRGAGLRHGASSGA